MRITISSAVVAVLGVALGILWPVGRSASGTMMFETCPGNAKCFDPKKTFAGDSACTPENCICQLGPAPPGCTRTVLSQKDAFGCAVDTDALCIQPQNLICAYDFDCITDPGGCMTVKQCSTALPPTPIYDSGWVTGSDQCEND